MFHGGCEMFDGGVKYSTEVPNVPRRVSNVPRRCQMFHRGVKYSERGGK